MSDEKDNTIVQAFLSSGVDSKDCFRFFSRTGAQSGCYVLGWWAGHIAREYIKSSAVLKNWGTASHPIDVVPVNENMCKEIIRDCLLRRGASVEFYDKPIAGGPYACVQRGSPGNITDFETSLFEFEEAEIQLLSSGALIFGGNRSEGSGIRVGFASLNTTLRTITFAEYLDTIQLTSLDSLIVQNNLKSLTAYVLNESAAEEEYVRMAGRICERSRVNFSLVTLKELKQRKQISVFSSIQDALQAILRVPEERTSLASCPLATQAVENVLFHTDMADETNRKAYYLRRSAPSTHMRLDAAAIEALHLVSMKPEPRGTLPTSVFSWLNRCYTGMGSRCMRQWLLQPLRNLDDIHQRLTMVEILVQNPLLRDTLISEVLKRCNDMDRLNRKLQRRNLPLKDTQAFLNFVEIIPEAIRLLKNYKGQDAKVIGDEYVSPLEDLNEHVSNLKTLITATVDFSDRNMPRINPSFDDALAELFESVQEIQKSIEREYERVLSKYDWSEKQLKYEYHTSHGYVFRVSRKEDRQVRSSSELITVSTAKDGVRFVSEKLAALSDRYRQLNKEYESRQMDLKNKLVDTIATYLPVLDDTKELIASLDVLVAWSLVVKDSPRSMVRPVMRLPNEDEENSDLLLSICNVRHPLVELRQPHYTANSVQLTKKTNALVITGPNMGGKSTYMRSVGIAVVLAQAGCFVPADAAEITIRDAVMCRVGATDHLAQGVSTFMVEMLESAAILSSATADTLAIIDELGRGTSTYDGFGLAWSIAEEIAVKIRAALLFSTHFHEMTQLEAATQHVKNMHFGADVNEADGTIRFSYRLGVGPCGRSYGLHVASLANLPPEVVQDAKEKAADLECFDNAKLDAVATIASGESGLEITSRVAAYAARIRELETIDDTSSREGEKKRLIAELTNDPLLQPLLSSS